jgi:hypothetical protein
VLTALRWLKKYNILYEDVIVDESNLDWLNGEENDMSHYEKTYVDKNKYDKDNNRNNDLGPAETQTVPLAEAADLSSSVTGVIDESAPVFQSENDKERNTK